MPIRWLLSLVAPPICVACGATAAAREPLCATCRGALRWLGAEPFQAAVVADATGPAREPLPAGRTPDGGLTIWTPVAYDGPARALVAALKFRGARRVAGAMAAQIAAAAPPGWLEEGSLVPVPLHPARARRRGFNQAALLAEALSARTGRRVDDCLERRGSRATQMGRRRAERLRGVSGSVRAAPNRVVPAHAVLVDDVVTTGATLAACAGALRAAGARSVGAVAYARTPGR